ncbi:GIY-YIG nuclease family protein [Parachitinimonas caeni]|uniref:GIY-YIG nuclease family protein n=1 Tax=Parachitinimonas caeni TaxID=3031301 RepID=A0ABT7DYP8_9NEIS|nr:hypothetical protein [Parachitinimonas caeni]MDK2125171.1 hypothetical protein [Parachitinimonas caeni]
MTQKGTNIIPWGCVYKVTFPNGKIYVGRDTAATANMDFFKYFGSPKAGKRDMLADMGEYLNGQIPYTVSKEILYSAENVMVKDLNKKEKEFIKALNAKDPAIGYNR